GRPIANTQLYVLDRSGEPTAAGAAGGLHIGGVGLARGYHQRAELTADRVGPGPVGSSGDRVSRTGDQGGWGGGGTLAFLGRLDQQVKLRGFRIELGEVEAALMEHSSVREAVAIVREDATHDRHLVAYVTGSFPSSTDLRQFAAERLPAFMVPSNI